MSFQPNIPLATDLISDSQQDILDNFTSIGTTFNVNHVDFNASGAGKHSKVEMPNNPSVTGVAGQATLFAASGDVWAVKGNGTPYQLTYGPPGTGTTNSFSFLPGQYVIGWGRSSVSNGSVVVIPGFTTTYNVTLTVEDAGGGTSGIANVRAVGAGDFTVNTNGSVVIRWIAIGN